MIEDASTSVYLGNKHNPVPLTDAERVGLHASKYSYAISFTNDTVAKIASRHWVTPAQIVAANGHLRNINTRSALRVGVIVRVPVPPRGHEPSRGNSPGC